MLGSLGHPTIWIRHQGLEQLHGIIPVNRANASTGVKATVLPSPHSTSVRRRRGYARQHDAYLSDAAGDVVERVLLSDVLTSGPDGVDKRHCGLGRPTLNHRAAAGSAGSACGLAFSSGAGGLSGGAGQCGAFPG